VHPDDKAMVDAKLDEMAEKKLLIHISSELLEQITKK
jgi:hypothetical protein